MNDPRIEPIGDRLQQDGGYEIEAATHTNAETEWIRRHVVAVVTFAVMSVALWSVSHSIVWTAQQWNAQHKPTWVGNPLHRGPKGPECDIDTWFIHGGLITAPHFADTFRWWVGTWAGQVPFYRPISSLVFWCEWKLFGDHELRYAVVSILVYLLAAYQFVRLATELFQSFRHPRLAAASLVAGLLFVHGLFLLPQQPYINVEVYSRWKNVPDTLCALFVFRSFRAYLRARSKGGTAEGVAPTPLQRSVVPYGALAWYLAACASKEAGVLLPLALLWLEWPGLRAGEAATRHRTRMRLFPMIISLPMFLIFRAVCLHTLVGFRYGSNRSLGYRFLADIFSIVSKLAAAGDFMPLTLGLVLLGLGFALARRAARLGGLAQLRSREWLAWIMGALALLAGLALIRVLSTPYALHSALDVFVALEPYLEADTLLAAVVVAIFIAAVAHLLRMQFRLGLFCYLWVLLAFLPTLASPTTIHRFYLVNAGYALLLGAGLTWWDRRPDINPKIS